MGRRKEGGSAFHRGSVVAGANGLGFLGALEAVTLRAQRSER